VIDAGQFGEWIVAKAEKLGAFTSVENLRIACEAVEIALARDGDEIHVTCVLHGASGTVPIDERMTRTAAGVLFPKVTGHRVPMFEPRPEPKPEGPPRVFVDYERIQRERRERLLRRNIVVIAGAIVLAFAISGVAFALLTHGDHDTHSGGKRETHH
jgi:hypothetical protein